MAEQALMSRQRLEAFEAVLFVVLSVGLATLALFCGHLYAVNSDRATLQGYADRLLDRAVGVASLTEQTLQNTPSAGENCSDADMERLRRVIFYSSYLRDIGRLQGHQLACSAIWGLQTRSLSALPAPTYQLPDIRFWTNQPHPADPEVLNDMAARGDTIVVTSPTVFDEFMLPTDSTIAAKVTSHDDAHLFRVFGHAGALSSRPTEAWYEIGSTRHVRQCDDRYRLCVVAGMRGSGLFAGNLAPMLGLGLLGAISGASLAGVLIGRRRRDRSLPMQLHRALSGNGLMLLYQPLRTLQDRRLVGAETLARWQTEQGAWVPPDVFIPMAARLGLTSQVTRQVVRKALQQMAPRLRGKGDFYLSLNVTAQDLLDLDFHAYLHGLVTAYQIDPARIVLELTEQSTTAPHELTQKVSALKAHGYRFYIDDFGTGYSNINTLAHLPINAIKIDKLFIQAIGTDSPIDTVIAPMCDIARKLSVDLVVEGVEKEEQARYVLAYAPRAVGQGWLLGKPVTIEQFPVT